MLPLEHKQQKIKSTLLKFIIDIRLLLKILFKASKLSTISILLISCLGGVLTYFEIQSIAFLVNSLSNNIKDGSIQLIFPWILLLVGSLLLRNIITSLRPYIASILNEKINETLKMQFFHKSINVPLEIFEDSEYHNKLERTNSMLNGRIANALQSFGALLTSVIEFLIIIYSVMKVNVFLGIALFIVSTPVTLMVSKAYQEFGIVNYNQSPLRRLQNYWIGISTNREYASELRLFDLGKFVLKRWIEISQRLIAELFMERKKVAAHLLKSLLIMKIIIFIVITSSVYMFYINLITIGVLVSLFYLMNRYESIMNDIVSTGEEVALFYFEFHIVNEFLSLIDEEEASYIRKNHLIDSVISFENINFMYPGQSKMILENINFNVKKGERIAIVGENGAGKSTLAKLLLGLYKPSSGLILINNQTKFQFRETCAAVFQNFVHYEATAKENITFGSIEYCEDNLKLIDAAAKSGAEEFINLLPNRYETMLGRIFEGAQDLSSGQWQKLGISRAFFKDVEILVLDEPASALDARSEYDIYRQFEQNSAGRTVFLISHKLGSARLADRIIFLENGRIIETGSHDELILLNGKYAEMYNAQAEWYKEG